MGENDAERLAETQIGPRRMKDLPPEDRPREKMLLRGIESLSDAELLAIFFGSGVVGMNAVEMGRQLLQKYGTLTALSRMEVQQLMEQKGVGEAKAIHLAAALALGRRLAHERFRETPMDTPAAIAELLGPEMRMLPQESLRVVLHTTRLTLLSVHEIHIGSVNEVSANISEVLRPVIVQGAYAFSLAHNHPSGDPDASVADRNFTRRLKDAAAVMQIRFLDHVIIGQPSSKYPDGYFSFREVGLL